VPFKGWAMEARVYAEDPLRGFLPSTGPLVTYKEPTAHMDDVEVRKEGRGL
jgi:propionyl-CoA carboxylase alpha chain